MAFCDFGKTVKKKLVDIDKTQDWLIEQVKKETGMFVDSSYLYKLLTGQRSPPQIVDAIRKILDLQEKPSPDTSAS